MANLVTTVAQIEKNILTLERFRNGTREERKFYSKRIKNGKLFVVLPVSNAFMFAPSRFAGYQDNDLGHESLVDKDGRETNVQIDKLLGKAIDFGDSGYESIDDAFLEFCEQQNIEPSRHHRKRRYWLLPHSGSRESKVTMLPDEVSPSEGIWEGALEQILVNRYERSPKARADCLAHYGSVCVICDVGLDQIYGEIGAGVIHVHHVVALSTIKKGYEVDPIKDLRPVCPNCHAVLHRGDGVSIERVRGIVHSLRKSRT